MKYTMLSFVIPSVLVGLLAALLTAQLGGSTTMVIIVLYAATNVSIVALAVWLAKTRPTNRATNSDDN